MLSFSIKPRILKEPIGSLLGFCELIIADTVSIEGFKVYKTRDGKLFAKPPEKESNQVDEKTGKNKWFPTVRFLDEKSSPDDWQTPFQQEVLKEMTAEFEKMMGAQGTSTSASSEGSSSSPPTNRKKNPLWG